MSNQKEDPLKDAMKDFIKRFGLSGIQVGSSLIDKDGNVQPKKKKKRKKNVD